MNNKQHTLEHAAKHETRAISKLEKRIEEDTLTIIRKQGFHYDAKVPMGIVYRKGTDIILYCPDHDKIIAKYEPSTEHFDIYINGEERKRHKLK